MRYTHHRSYEDTDQTTLYLMSNVSYKCQLSTRSVLLFSYILFSVWMLSIMVFCWESIYPKMFHQHEYQSKLKISIISDLKHHGKHDIQLNYNILEMLFPFQYKLIRSFHIPDNLCTFNMILLKDIDLHFHYHFRLIIFRFSKSW